MFKNLSNKILFLIIFIFLIISSIFVYLYVINIFNDTILLVAAITSFIVISMATNQLTQRLVNKKFEKKYHNPKEYILEVDIKESLKDVSSTKLSFGMSYLLINNNVAYKILIIENNELYFNNENKESNNNKSKSKLDKCNKFFGFEIFENVDSELIKKLELYTFQSEKIYYTAFYKNEDKLIQANFEEPNEQHIEDFNFIIKKLRMV